MKKTREKKRWPKILLLIILLIVCFLLYNLSAIKRLSTVITLFDKENISENFLNMEDIFPTSTVSASQHPSKLLENIKDLPIDFRVDDSTYLTSAFLDYSQTAGLLVLHQDTILHEMYGKGLSQQEDYISWSVSKSIISALIGIAVSQGDIGSISDPVDKYVPSLASSGYKGVSIKNVLNMSSGIEFDENYSNFNSDINKMGRVFALGLSFDKYVSSLVSERPAGEFHRYVSMDTQVLGMVLRGATGRNVSEYMENELWTKMGAEAEAYWLCDASGVEAVFGGLNARTRDYARFGLLYANMGYAEGKQIIDSTWIEMSTTATEEHLLPGINPKSNSILGYGFQWWIPNGTDGIYTANGVYNQYIFVDSINKIVIVKNSANFHYRENRAKTIKEHYAFLYAVRNAIINN